jgi:hypothetical protein
MSIRLPLRTILDLSDNGTSSVATGTISTFQIPQDADNLVLKLTASITGGGVCAFLQTTDDGGTTWYDLGRTSIVSDATNATAHWLSIPVNGAGIATSVNKSSSLLSTASGAATASTTGQQQVTGLPVLSQTGRVVLSYSAAGTANTVSRAQIMTNSQSATA